MRNIFCLIIILIFVCSCDTKERSSANTDSSPSDSLIFTRDMDISSLYPLLERAYAVDSMEFVSDSLPLAYFKSGYFLDSEKKNALLIFNPADTAYCIELYTMRDSVWTKSDDIPTLWGMPSFFDIKYEDYNFDGHNDIYIRTSVSTKGMSVAYGHLITVNPVTKKMMYHKEAYKLGNLTLDSENQVIYSQEVVITNYGEKKYQTATNKWEEKQLITVRKDNPDEPTQAD